jgi:hypothetical protein
VSERRPLLVALALAVAVLFAAAAPVGADSAPLPSTVPPPTLPPRTLPTTTTLPVVDTQPPPTSPQVTVGPPPGDGGVPAVDNPTTTSPVAGSPPDGSPAGDAPVGDGGVGSPDAPKMGDDAVALILDDRIRSGASSTAALLDALRPLTALGFSEQEAFMTGMGRFPVGGLATWSDDFHDPRYNPTPHLHQGNDIWTAFDTPVRSPADGVVSFTDEVVGGKSAYVTTPDGTYYYMTHLDGFPTDLSSGMSVAQGRLVGYAGATGNAAGGPPHVHFEIHPGGGGAVNPKPILDQWVADALTAARTQVVEKRDANPRVLLATGELRRFDVPSAATSERAAKSPLLWSASVSPGGAVLRLAEVEATRMALRVDWSRRAQLAQANAVDRHRAQQRAMNLLSRLTPAGLRPVLDGGTA